MFAVTDVLMLGAVKIESPMMFFKQRSMHALRDNMLQKMEVLCVQASTSRNFF